MGLCESVGAISIYAGFIQLSVPVIVHGTAW